MADNAPDDSDAARKAIIEAAREAHAARQRLGSAITAGNAGGLIATLALIGSALSRSAGASSGYPAVYYFVALAFLLGLAFSYLAILADEFRSEWHLKALVDGNDARAVFEDAVGSPKSEPAKRAAEWRRVIHWSIRGSILCLGIGISLALPVLESLTR